MKKIGILLTLVAFLAEPTAGMTGAQAASLNSTNPASSSEIKLKKSTSISAAQITKLKVSKSRVQSRAKHRVKKQAKVSKPVRVAQYAVQQQPPLRAMRAAFTNTQFGNELDLRASAALVVDQKSGEALYAKNIDIPTAIASITKLMTAMVTLDANLNLDEEIVVNGEDVDRLKGTGSRLALGTTLTRVELLHLALIASENRAAAALSRAYPGGRPAFIAAMNRKARELGMSETHFIDSTGLNSSNRSTASDLVKMVDAACRYSLIREITSTGSYDVSVPGTRVVKVKENGKVRKVQLPVQRHIAFNNTNSLTRDQDWEIGVSKTGFINEAGHCLVMQTKIAEHKVIIVLLDSVGKWGRIGDAQRIRKWLERDNRLLSQLNYRKST